MSSCACLPQAGGLALNPARTERHVRVGLQACLRQAGTHQTENPLGFSEVGENKQLLIANVSCWLLFLMMMFLFMLFQ
jgi:hypothetical protein